MFFPTTWVYIICIILIEEKTCPLHVNYQSRYLYGQETVLSITILNSIVYIPFTDIQLILRNISLLCSRYIISNSDTHRTLYQYWLILRDSIYYHQHENLCMKTIHAKLSNSGFLYEILIRLYYHHIQWINGIQLMPQGYVSFIRSYQLKSYLSDIHLSFLVIKSPILLRLNFILSIKL